MLATPHRWIVGALALGLGAPGASAQDPASALAKTVDALRVHAYCRLATSDCANDADLRRVETFVAALAATPLPASPATAPSREELDAALTALANIALIDTDAAGMRAEVEAFAPGLGTLVVPTSGRLAAGAGGALSFPRVALTVTDFLIARAKAELALTTFRSLRDELASGDLALLLPTTVAALRDLDAIGYRAIVPTFRAAVRKDLRDLPFNITDTLSFYPSRTPPPEVRLLGAVAGVVVRVDGGEDVLAAIARLRTESSAWNASPTRDLVQLAGAVASEVRAATDMAAATSGAPSLPALLAMRLPGAVFVDFVLADTDLRAALEARLWSDLTQLGDLVREAQRLQTLLTSAQPMFGGGSVAPEQTAAQVLAQVGVLLAAGVATAAPPGTPAGDRLRSDVALALDIAKAAREDDYPTVLALVLRRVPDDALPAGFVRMATFAASVASVDTEEELTEAIEAFVDPVGSFRSRRLAGAWKLSLVSYVGASAGRESAEEGEQDDSGFGGAFAPIGLELSWGTGRTFPASVGILGSFVDLGTLVSYRFKDDATVSDDPGSQTIGAEPEISWRHLFSPAAHLVLGVSREHPVSVGFGVQRAPALRSLSSGEAVSVTRVSAFVGVDLTLFRF